MALSIYFPKSIFSARQAKSQNQKKLPHKNGPRKKTWKFWTQFSLFITIRSPDRTMNWSYHRRKTFSSCDISLLVHLTRNVFEITATHNILPFYRGEKKNCTRGAQGVVFIFYEILLISSIYESYLIRIMIKEEEVIYVSSS